MKKLTHHSEGSQENNPLQLQLTHAPLDAKLSKHLLQILRAEKDGQLRETFDKI